MDFDSLAEAEDRGTTAQGTAEGGSVRNVALGRPVRASSVRSANRAAANAVDGDPATRWTSEYADDQWLAVDLGEVHELARVDVRWEAAHAALYLVQASLNGLSWVTLASAMGNEGWVQTRVQAGSLARWVRVSGKKRATSYGFSIYELSVLGAECSAASFPSWHRKRAWAPISDTDWLMPPHSDMDSSKLSDIWVHVVGGLSGETLYEARMDASDLSLRVRDIKRLISEQEGTPVCEQQILHGDQLLGNGEAIGAVMQQAAAATTVGGIAGPRDGLELLMLRLPPGRAKMLQDLERGAKNLWDLPDELQQDHDFVLTAVRRNALALKFSAEAMKDDRELVLALVQEQGEALKYASKRLKDDPELVRAAMKRHPAAIRFASHALRGNVDLMLDAMQNQRSAMHFADPQLLADPGFRARAEKTGVFRSAEFEHLLQITPGDARELQEKGSCIFLDARDQAEFEASHVAQAHHKSEMARFKDVPALRRGFQEPGQHVVVYSDNGLDVSRCRGYARSLRENPHIQAFRVLRLTGGLNAWKQAGHPVDGNPDLMLRGQVVPHLRQLELFQSSMS